MKPIFQLSGNSRVISVNAFEVGTGLLVAGGIRDDGFTAGEIGERESWEEIESFSGGPVVYGHNSSSAMINRAGS